MLEEVPDRLGMRFAVAELVVGVFDRNRHRLEPLALAQLHERLRRREELPRPEHQVVGAHVATAEPRRPDRSHLGLHDRARRHGQDASTRLDAQARPER